MADDKKKDLSPTKPEPPELSTKDKGSASTLPTSTPTPTPTPTPTEEVLAEEVGEDQKTYEVTADFIFNNKRQFTGWRMRLSKPQWSALTEHQKDCLTEVK